MYGKCVVFILGMGRSGTSALTRVLSLCGCALPTSLHNPTIHNPRGYWEPLDVLNLNDEWLFRHGATWFDPTLQLQEEIAFETRAREDYLAQIGAFLTGCCHVPQLVIKEPRITALFDFWLEAARRAAFSVKVIICIRDPGEVVASQGVLGTSAELSHALWLKYNLLAERRSRDLPRVVVNYSNLLTDWRVEMSRISRCIAVDLHRSDATAIETFLTRDLYRQRNSGPATDVFGCAWTSRVHTILCNAAQDGSIDCAELDKIYAEFSACERAFRTSLDEFRNKYNPRRIRESKALDGWSPPS